MRSRPAMKVAATGRWWLPVSDAGGALAAADKGGCGISLVMAVAPTHGRDVSEAKAGNRW